VGPLALYSSVILALIVLGILLRVYQRIVTRVCPMCDARVELGRRWCQQCGYKFDTSRW
jgi:predicted amidophosphoribosyltransferase